MVEIFVFACLFWICNRIRHTGSTPKREPTKSSPITQATRHPRASLLFMYTIPPPPPILMSCSLHQVSTLPCPPVPYRYPTKYLVCPSLSSRPTHIFNPPLPKYEPLKTPHINCVTLLLQTELSKV